MLAAFASVALLTLVAVAPVAVVGTTVKSYSCARHFNSAAQIKVTPDPRNIGFGAYVMKSLWQYGTAGDCSAQCVAPKLIAGPHGGHMEGSPEGLQSWTDPTLPTYLKPGFTTPTGMPACLKYSLVLALSDRFAGAQTPGAMPYEVDVGVNGYVDAVGNVLLCNLFFSWDGALASNTFDGSIC